MEASEFSILLLGMLAFWTGAVWLMRSWFYRATGYEGEVIPPLFLMTLGALLTSLAVATSDSALTIGFFVLETIIGLILFIRDFSWRPRRLREHREFMNDPDWKLISSSGHHTLHIYSPDEESSSLDD